MNVLMVVALITVITSSIALRVGDGRGYKRGSRAGYLKGSADGFRDGQSRRTLGSRP